MNRRVAHPLGHYHFLPGIAPYSCGVIADPGHEIVRVTLPTLEPWRAGFERLKAFLREQGRARAELCAIELRSPQPFTMEGFIQFNRGYCAVLEQWGVFVNGANPIARTNVCPVALEACEPVLQAFSFVRPASGLSRRTFVVAGAGELIEGTLVSHGIIRRGETTPEAMAEKALYVGEVMTDRLSGLGADWSEVTAVNAYTIHSLHSLMRPLLGLLPAAQRHGVCWHFTRPPVIDIEFEMDLRGVAAEWQLA